MNVCLQPQRGTSGQLVGANVVILRCQECGKELSNDSIFCLCCNKARAPAERRYIKYTSA